MRAIVINSFGAPEVLVEAQVEDPSVGPGQALIDVEVVNVTFVETQVRSGRAPHPSMLPELPVIPGNGVGGTVAAVGPGASEALLGTRVVSSTGGSGAYAELVCVPEAGLMSVPDEMELKNAVAVLADGRTAIALISQAQLRAGETVLIEAAAGGVGSLLVQLAKAAGARVVAVAGGERKVTLARELGADIAIDYSKESWTSEVENALTSATPANGTHPLDVVFDGVGGAIGRAAFDLLERGGRHCAFGMASGGFAAIDERDGTARGVKVLRGTRLDPPEMRRLTRAALEQVAAGRLHPVVGQTFPLADAAQAHRAIETRSTVGKTLLIT